MNGSLDSYGLAPPRVVITTTTTKEEDRLIKIGNDTPVGYSSYAVCNPNGAPQATRSRMTYALPIDPKELLSLDVFTKITNAPQDLKSITLADDTKIEFINAQWFEKSPNTILLDSKELTYALDQLSSIKAQDLSLDVDLEEDKTLIAFSFGLTVH